MTLGVVKQQMQVESISPCDTDPVKWNEMGAFVIIDTVVEQTTAPVVSLCTVVDDQPATTLKGTSLN